MENYDRLVANEETIEITKAKEIPTRKDRNS